MKTIEEWIAVYEKKLGMKYVPNEHELWSYHPDHGFLSFIDPAYSEPGVFEIHLVVGNGKYWAKLIKEVMRATGCTKATSVTRRSPHTWARRYGAKIRAYVMEVDINDLKS
jgi:hypothetical protein